MAAGNWNSQLYINNTTGFVEWPNGPLRFPGEKMLRVEAWLVQSATGAMQMTFQPAGDFPTPGDSHSWLANRIWYPRKPLTPGPGYTWDGTGRFTPGPALGTAVAISTNPSGSEQYVYWWTQEVELDWVSSVGTT